MNERQLPEVLRASIAGQFAAAMCTLWQAVAGCPDADWQERHGDQPFSQVVFHVLFYTDLYLGKDMESFRTQAFHLANPSFFGDYEELEDHEPVRLYDKAMIREYFGHCLSKGEKAIGEEDGNSFAGPSGFELRSFSRAELYLYLIRHIQHHAAQLGLRLQPLTGRELAWVGSGWKGPA
jgi:hypothetical protein